MSGKNRVYGNPQKRVSAFTLMELLVVIGILVLLVGLLIPALSAVRTQSKKVSTRSLMKMLGDSTDSFRLATNRYPGMFTEMQLAGSSEKYFSKISSTENALIELMGGLQQRGNDQFKLATKTLWRDDIGKGPVINGQHHDAYFIPSPGDLYYVNGQIGQDEVFDNHPDTGQKAYPDLVDAWGTPIIFWQSSGQKPSDPAEMTGFLANGVDAYNYYYASFQSYTGADELRVGRDHRLATNQMENSILYWEDKDIVDLTQKIIEHPTITGTQRGAYVIMSAGKDMFYFNKDQLSDAGIVGRPDVLEDFDDIIEWGGS